MIRISRPYVLILFVLVGLSCKRSKPEQYVVVHVLRDPSASFARELSETELRFGSSTRRLPNGKLIIVATNEGDSFSGLLQRLPDSPWELVIFDSPAAIPNNPAGQSVLGERTDVCGHHPAFIPPIITGEQREAAQAYLQFLVSSCNPALPLSWKEDLVVRADSRD